MNRRKLSRRRLSTLGCVLTIAGVVFGCVLLTTAPSRAGEGTMTAPESVVRSAPFDVAPEIARVRAGDRLFAEDQPSGTWRRVQLPDGRFGFVNGADIAVVVAAPVAPDAPVAADAGTVVEPAPAAPDGGSAAPAGVSVAPTDGSGAVVSAGQPTSEEASPTLAGVLLQLMPVGTLRGTNTMTNARISSDTIFAVGVAPFVDVGISPCLALGISPQMIFRVKGDGAPSPQSATEYDLRVRVTGRVPVSDSSYVYGRFSPGYSFISLPDGATNVDSDPKGLVLDVAVGGEFALLPKLFLVVDLGYQIGFQTGTTSDTSSEFDAHTRYLHVGSGLALRL